MTSGYCSQLGALDIDKLILWLSCESLLRLFLGPSLGQIKTKPGTPSNDKGDSSPDEYGREENDGNVYRFCSDLLKSLCQNRTQLRNYTYCRDECDRPLVQSRRTPDLRKLAMRDVDLHRLVSEHYLCELIAELLHDSDSVSSSISAQDTTAILNLAGINEKELETLFLTCPMLEQVLEQAGRNEILDKVSCPGRRMSFDGGFSTKTFCKEWLWRFGAQLDNLAYYYGPFFDNTLLANCSQITQLEIIGFWDTRGIEWPSVTPGTKPLLPNLKVIECNGSAIKGIPPASVEHINVGHFHSFSTAEEWRTIGEKLPLLKYLFISNWRGLTASLVEEVLPKLSFFKELHLPSYCDGNRLDDSDTLHETFRSAGISLNFHDRRNLLFFRLSMLDHARMTKDELHNVLRSEEIYVSETGEKEEDSDSEEELDSTHKNLVVPYSLMNPYIPTAKSSYIMDRPGMIVIAV